MTDKEPKRNSNQISRRASPLSLAFEWVARITAIGFVMILPGIAGQWLDLKLQTSFLALLGFAIGFVAGFVALLAMVQKKGNSSRSERT